MIGGREFFIPIYQLMAAGAAVLLLPAWALYEVVSLQAAREPPSWPRFWTPTPGGGAVAVFTLLAAIVVDGLLLPGQRAVRGLRLLGAILALLHPGLILGALLTLALCTARPRPGRYLIRGGLITAGLMIIAFTGWPLSWPLALILQQHVEARGVIGAGLVEALLGAAWLRLFADLTTAAELDRRLVRQGEQLQTRLELAAGPENIAPPFWRQLDRHRPGWLLLGVDRVNRRALEVPLAALSRHATIVGATGAGKTVTIGRLTDGVLAQPEPWAVVVLDCKGGSLREACQQVAALHGVRFQEVNPGRQGSLCYNPARLGTPAEIADKIASAFEGGPESAVYRDQAYHALARVAQAQHALGKTLSMATIAGALDRTAMVQLSSAAQRDGHGRHAAELHGIAERMGNSRQTTSSAINAVIGRIGAVGAGRFEEIFDDSGPELDLIEAMARPGITYIALPATASVQDVRTVGRILLADFKLVAHRRLVDAQRERLCRCLLVVDEFLSLGSPEGIQDLLRQTREANIAAVTASQYLPDPGEYRKQLLQVGVLIFLKCLDEEAEVFANLCGTVIGRTLVREVEFLPWRSHKGAVGPDETFRVHPRWFRHFANPGQAGIRFDVPGQLPTATVVQIYREEAELTPAGRAWCWLTRRLSESPSRVTATKRTGSPNGPARPGAAESAQPAGVDAASEGVEA